MSNCYGSKLLKMIEDDLLDKDQVILAFVKWNTSDDIYEMMRANEMLGACEEGE